MCNADEKRKRGVDSVETAYPSAKKRRLRNADDWGGRYGSVNYVTSLTQYVHTVIFNQTKNHASSSIVGSLPLGGRFSDLFRIKCSRLSPAAAAAGYSTVALLPECFQRRFPPETTPLFDWIAWIPNRNASRRIWLWGRIIFYLFDWLIDKDPLQASCSLSFSVSRALNYHGQQLTSFMKDSEICRQIDLKNVDYHLYQQVTT